jgi:nucleoside-diphosphate-sugar epimerase
MRVLITGGTGFLGRHLVWHLVRAGHDVVFTGRNRAQASEVLTLTHSESLAGSASFVALAHGDPASAQTLSAAARGADAIIHCAGLSSPWGRRDAFERANIASAREVIDACAAHGIARLVHISTPSLYFDFRDRIDIRENEPLPSPVNEYARTKGIAEQQVMHSQIESVIALRPRAIFGPWDNTLLPRLLRVARKTQLPLMRDGAALIDMTYVDNVVHAVMLALAADLRRATFNITNGEPMPVIALFKALADGFGFDARFRSVPYPLLDAIARTLEFGARFAPGWEPPLTRYSAGLLAFSQTLDLTQAREVLGYQPKVTFSDGLQRTATWFATHKDHA